MAAALDAATLAVLPEDAPPGHRAHAKVTLSGRRCKVAFTRGRGPKTTVITYQIVVADCGSEAVALHLARAMWLRLEQGATREEVLRLKSECCAKLKALAAEAAEAPSAAEAATEAAEANVADAPAAGEAAAATGAQAEVAVAVAAAAVGPAASETELEEPPAPAPAGAAVKLEHDGPDHSSVRLASGTPTSAAKRRKLSSPQASSCGRLSTSSSTLSPGKFSPLSVCFGAGVRTLREALAQKGVEPRGCWWDLVDSLERLEQVEAEQTGVASSSSTCVEGLPTVDVPSSQEVPEAVGISQRCADAGPAPSRSVPPRPSAVKRKVGSKRPPATPQRTVVERGLVAGAVAAF